MWQFSINRTVFFFSCTFVIIACVGLLWILQDYLRIKKEMPRLVGLERENKNKDVQLAALAERIDSISQMMVESKKFDDKLRVMANLEPDGGDSPLLGVGGSDPQLLNPKNLLETGHRKLVRKMHESLDHLDTEISIQNTSKAELCTLLENQKKMLACMPSIWPARGWVSSRFGYRISPFTNKREFHKGLDIAAKMGAPIVAPADGVVSYVGKNYGYGNVVVLNHNNGIKTKYAHVEKSLVKKGQSVKRGEKIALVGKTGRSTGPHLHYEVHQNGVAVDPLRYIFN